MNRCIGLAVMAMASAVGACCDSPPTAPDENRFVHAWHCSVNYFSNESIGGKAADEWPIVATLGASPIPASGSPVAATDPIRVNKRHESPNFWATVDIPMFLSLPVVAVSDILRMLVVEDADSLFKATNYDTFIRYLPGATFDSAKDFTVSIRMLAVDNFTEGRLRDSLGGNGGELSLQASIAALNANGELLDQDLELLVTEDLNRRFPLLTLLQGTEKGSEWVKEMEQRANQVMKFVGEVDGTKKRITAELEKVKDKLTNDDWRKSALADAKTALLAKIPDDKSDLRTIAGVLLDALMERLEKRLEGSGWDWSRVEPEIDKVIAMGAPLDAVLGQAARLQGGLGIDEKGFYERVTVIKNLAQADHLCSLEFDGIRPSAFAGSDGTAAVLFDSAKSDPTHAARKDGMVFQGKLSDLSRLGAANGFSLSTLLIERDSDKVAQALHAVESYARSRNLTVDVAGTGVEVSVIAEALAEVADKIAEDDVELKSIDVRFFPKAAGAMTKGGGPTLFELAPCDVYVGRNLDGKEFGAIAVIEIRQ